MVRLVQFTICYFFATSLSYINVAHLLFLYINVYFLFSIHLFAIQSPGSRTLTQTEKLYICKVQQLDVLSTW